MTSGAKPNCGMRLRYLGSRGLQKSNPVTHKSDISGGDRCKAEGEPCSNHSFPAILDPKIGLCKELLFISRYVVGTIFKLDMKYRSSRMKSRRS